MDNGILRGCVDTVGAQQHVGVEGHLAEHFGQATLHVAARHFHLPETVLRVGVAQPKGSVRKTVCNDVGYGVLVAHDAYRTIETGHFNFAIILGYRETKGIDGIEGK